MSNPYKLFRAMIRHCRHLARLFLLVILLSFTAQAKEFQKLQWNDLIPPIAPYNDPFLSLSTQQKRDLATIARARAQQSSSDLSGISVAPPLEGAIERLKSAQIDIEGLLARRSFVAAKRREAAESTNNKLNGQFVQIAGYVLPLNFDSKRVTEFLLVPYVGTCIHEPRPNANQIIRVNYPMGIATRGHFEAVLIKGRIRVAKSAPSIWLVDGRANVPTSYAFDVESIGSIQKQGQGSSFRAPDSESPNLSRNTANGFPLARRHPFCMNCESR